MDFHVPRWLANPHLQTIAVALPLWAKPRDFDVSDVDVHVPAHEGGSLLARVSFQRGEEPRGLVVLVHGVGGSSESMYMRRAAVALYRAGYHVARLNLQGAGVGIERAEILYHAGLSSDLAGAIDLFARDPRVDHVAVVGFSLGGNVALKLAGEWGHDAPKTVRAVVAISAPADLLVGSRLLEERGTMIYRRWTLRGLISEGEKFARLHPDRVAFDPAELRSAKTIRAYDERVIVPMHGFESVDAYYGSESCGPFLPKIRMPTLMLHADDDPMVPGHTVRPWLSGLDPAVRVVFSDRGGHVGWFGGLGERHFIDTWAMKKTLAFLAEHAPAP